MMHTIELDHLVIEPEEGLLLGNGDLSVSIYQKSGRIIWRFGKNDVWDRRLDLSDSPKPAHIDEIARGIRDEGWVAVAVPTSSDEGGMESELERIAQVLATDPVGIMRQWEQDNEASAAAFWNRSAVTIDDPLVENIWYETLHARRCAYRAGVIAPGLAEAAQCRLYHPACRRSLSG